jgi:hypothetical protein
MHRHFPCPVNKSYLRVKRQAVVETDRGKDGQSTVEKGRARGRDRLWQRQTELRQAD